MVTATRCPDCGRTDHYLGPNCPGGEYRGQDVTEADFAALHDRHRNQELADANTLGEPGRPGGRIVCHGCGARVFRYSTAASGREYCPTCVRRIAGD